MPRSDFPWPPALGASSHRTRHTRTGDTIPPTFPAGEASITKRIPYSEGAPTGHGSGSYLTGTEGIGFGEPATGPALNRALYGLASDLDAVNEMDKAQLLLSTSTAGVSPVGGGFELDLTAAAWASPLVYLGPAGTTASGGADPSLTCDKYIRFRTRYGLAPWPDPATGDEVLVQDVLSAPSAGVGASLYAALPAANQVYPFGSAGVIELFPAADTVRWATAAAPVPPSGAATHTCLFNYSLFERALEDPTIPMDNAFAIIIAQTLVPPPLDSTTNRAGLVVDGWAIGDHVYTTHFAWSPTLSLDADFTNGGPAQFATIVHGTFSPLPRFQPRGLIDWVRFLGEGTPVLAPALEVVEPAAATLRSFDYANALFRGVDGTLKGTVGFDFAGAADTPAAAEDAYAGFLHRKALDFNDGNNTTLAQGNAATWVGNTVTLLAGQFKGKVSDANTQVLPGVDLLYLEDSGAPVGLFVISALVALPNQTDCTILELDGSVPVLGAPAAGTVTLFRPQARTGIWDAAGLLAGISAGTLLAGDDYGGIRTPALRLQSVGLADVIEGWGAAMRTAGPAITQGPGVIFRVLSSGALYFAGTPDAADTDYTNLHADRMTGAPWNVGSESWSTYFMPYRTPGAAPWTTRRAAFHALDDWAGGGASFRSGAYFHLSTTGSYMDGLIPSGALTEAHAGLIMGLPGGAEFPIGPPGNEVFSLVPRDAGYLYSYLDAAGNMTVGLGFTAPDPSQRGFDLRQAPTGMTVPAIPFGAAAARIESDVETSYGWAVALTLYHHCPLVSGQNLDSNPAGPGPWFYDDSAPSIPPALAYWQMVNGALGVATYIDFPIELPQGSQIIVVEIKYYVDAWAGGGVSYNPDVYVLYQTSNCDVGNEAVAAAETLVAGVTAYAPALAAGWFVIRHTLGAPEVINNRTRFYWVRVWGGYDAGGAGPMTIQRIAGVRVTFEMQDILPA